MFINTGKHIWLVKDCLMGAMFKMLFFVGFFSSVVNVLSQLVLYLTFIFWSSNSELIFPLLSFCLYIIQ